MKNLLVLIMLCGFATTLTVMAGDQKDPSTMENPGVSATSQNVDTQKPVPVKKTKKHRKAKKTIVIKKSGS